MAGVFDTFKYERSSIFSSSSNLLLISQNIHKDGLANQKALFSDHNSEENFIEGPSQEQKLQKKEKVPRNAPCPCGSGKKYKHCHGAITA